MCSLIQRVTKGQRRVPSNIAIHYQRSITTTRQLSQSQLHFALMGEKWKSTSITVNAWTKTSTSHVRSPHNPHANQSINISSRHKGACSWVIPSMQPVTWTLKDSHITIQNDMYYCPVSQLRWKIIYMVYSEGALCRVIVKSHTRDWVLTILRMFTSPPI